jgi:hypothetical protein
MAWNLEDYETVDSRIHRFWESYPMGRIETELLSHERDRFIVCARLYRTDVDQLAFASGHAEELVSDRGVNSTSALENAETSAIGRALASAGLSAKGKRASRTEMAKVERLSVHKARPENVDQHQTEASEKPIPNEPQTVVWDVEESKAFSDDGDFLKVLNDTLGAEPITYGCKHGNRVFKQGDSRSSGKPWAMWACIETRKANQCEPMWGKLSDGKWLFELKAVNHG